MRNTLSRRGVLAAGLAAVSAAAAPARAAEPFFRRTGLPIGIQLYTLGPEAAKDLDATFAELAKIGYRTVELAGFAGRTPAELKAALDRAGLACPSAHIQPRGGFDGDLGKLAADLQVVGVKTAVAPIPYIPDRLLKPRAGEAGGDFLRRITAEMTADDWKWNAAFLNDKGAVLKKAGLGIGYHNHNFEFAPLGDTNGMEILLKETNPEIVAFEIDVGWVSAAGADPAALMAAHKGRFSQMHVKDLKPGTKTNFTLTMEPTEVGSGAIDWKKLLPAAHAAGVRGFFVEQEPPFERPRIEAAKISHDFLARVAT